MARVDLRERLGRIGLSTRLLLITLLTTIAAAVVAVAIVTRETRETTTALAMRYGIEAAERQAHEVARMLDTMGATVRAVGAAVAVWRDHGANARPELIDLLRTTLVDLPGALALWIILEPDVPGADADAAGRFDLGSNAEGRFAPLVIRLNGEIFQDQPMEAMDALWYALPKTHGHEVVLEPYVYPVGGHSTLIASLALPIFAGDQFIGVAGVDFSVEDLARILSAARPLGGSIGLVNSRGIWIAGSGEVPIGEHVGSLVPSEGMLHRAVEVGTVEGPEGPVRRVLVPFEVDRTNTVWAIVIDVPTAAIEAPTTRLRFKLIAMNVLVAAATLTILGLAITAYVGRPLAQTAQTIHRLASGAVDAPVGGTGRRDEIGDINRALESYRRSLQEDRDRRDQMRRILAALDLAGEGIIVADIVGRILFANTAAARIIGECDATRLSGRGWDELVASDRPQAAPMRIVAEAIAELEPAQDWTASLFFPAERGRERIIRVRARCLPKGRGIVLIGTDTTADRRTEKERRRIESRLRRSQKMEAVGQLTGGIAHDFNNLLTVILGNAELLTDSRGLGAREREATALIAAAADRAAALVAQLLAFARQQPLRPHPIDIAEHIDRLEPLLRRTLGPEITLTIRCPVRPLVATVDGSQLDSVIINLGVNARDAMREGGSLDIAIRPVELRRADLAGDPVGALPPSPGRYVEISARDNGVGIAAEVLPHVFEPFFTTKEVGAGSGLGLSMAYGFATQSGGGIVIESTPGRGTVIRLWLPRTE